MVNQVTSNATQDFVPISEVRDGVIILKNGGLRGVLMASSLNFALKSEDEQNAFIMQFQNFFNSLDFSVQICIQSRELDIRPYVALLESRLEKTTNDLMLIQIREYIEFIKNFVEASNIMEKSFFVVIPYARPVLESKNNPISIILGKKRDKEQERVNFEEALSQLEQRMAVVEQGLASSGVRVIKLNTEEVIELYYKIFNPGEQEKPIKLEQAQITQQIT